MASKYASGFCCGQVGLTANVKLLSNSVTDLQVEIDRKSHSMPSMHDICVGLKGNSVHVCKILNFRYNEHGRSHPRIYSCIYSRLFIRSN